MASATPNGGPRGEGQIPQRRQTAEGSLGSIICLCPIYVFRTIIRGASITASATLPFCSLIAAGFHPLRSIDIGDAPYQEGRALFARALGALARSYCQSDITTAISVGQPSWILRLRHLPSLVPLSSEPAEIQGPILKCHLGPQSGTVFA